MRVPAFLVRQFYIAGSLQREGDGFSLQATNPIGDGTLVGIGRISVDGSPVDPSAVSATRAGDDVPLRAADVSRHSPVAFRKGHVVTFHVAGHALTDGDHDFEVELYELNLGRLTLALRDRVRPGAPA